MSFSSTVKSEVCKLKISHLEIISEISAIIRNNGSFSDSLKITTENVNVAKMLFSHIKEIYNIVPRVIVRRGFNFHKNYMYILEITKKKDIMFKDLSLLNIPNEFIYADDELKRSYLRGLFMSSGSINDPKKSRYHLEFIVNNSEYANFVCDLLNDFKLNAKVIKRDLKYMIYIKEAEKIGDFLRLIKATNAILYYENIKIYREEKNMNNRINNCEQANVDKIMETASRQVKQINKIIEADLFILLDDKTKEAANYRLKYPEASILELSEIISMETGNKITKSGLYHRLKKISKQAEKLDK